MVSPVVSERRLLSLSKTAYNNNRYKRLLVRFMFSPLILIFYKVCFATKFCHGKHTSTNVLPLYVKSFSTLPKIVFTLQYA